MSHFVAVIALLSVLGCESLNTVTAPPDREPIELPEPTEAQLRLLGAADDAKLAGEYDVALTIFQDILAENPTITTAYLGIGEIHLVRKDYAKAEPAYARAARLEPRNFDAQYGHGLALQMLNRLVEAVRAYHRALTIDPDSVKANTNIATSYVQLRDPAKALTFAERAVEVDPSNGPARANLGAIYEELGQFNRAVDAYIAALELMGNRPPLMMNLINALGEENRYREAANTAESLLRIEPSAQAYERLGWCMFKLREYEQSMEAYRDAVDLDPTHWPALNGVGINALNRWLITRRGDAQARLEAREAFRRSLRVNPDQPKLVELMLKYGL
jgi:tetratricopeptide (TPR) repeat protein